MAPFCVSLVLPFAVFLAINRRHDLVSNSFAPSFKVSCSRSLTSKCITSGSNCRTKMSSLHAEWRNDESAESSSTDGYSAIQTTNTRREILKCIFPAAVIPCASAIAADGVLPNTDEGRLIEFTVANLDGQDGNADSFIIKTHPSWAPKGVQRFEELTEKRFWDDCRIFRVIPGFVSQFGINGNPDVQALWRKRSFSDDPVKVPNRRGTLVFATAGPNTRTTQIFINTGNRNYFLEKQGFSPIGEVVSGMDVVDRFYAGYGEGAPAGKGPSQSMLQLRGANYVKTGFPKLSYFVNARFVR